MASTIIDPLAQSFIIDGANFPNGVFLSSISLFFRTKPTTNIPIQLYILPTINGYPTGTSLDHSIVYLTSDKVNVSETPHVKNAATATKFTFDFPVYINPNQLYAFCLTSSSSEYNLWCAKQGDTALLSTSKANYTDVNPTSATKITTTPYVGDIFESQNSITWTADQTQDLMFVMYRCKFVTSYNPVVPFVVPRGLPERTQVDVDTATATSNATYDLFNVATTDFTPPGTAIDYQYTTTLKGSGTTDGPYGVTPGKFGTPMAEDVYLDDNLGQRVLDYASNTSFKLEATLRTVSDAVSPVISDDGLTVYTTRFRINNLGLANTDITVVGGGSGYLGGANGTLIYPNISVSAPTSTSGTQAYVSANVVSGNIVSVYVTTEGAGYITTPTISVIGTNTSAAQVVVTGETSASGGNGWARYITRPITLGTNNDSGDLRVFFTAYRPVGTNIHVYYKMISRDDTQSIEEGDWQLMTLVNGDSKYSISRNDIYEYEAAPGSGGAADNQVSYTSTKTGLSYTKFYQYMIKIVMTSNDPTFSPFLKDMRTLALPSGTGL